MKGFRRCFWLRLFTISLLLIVPLVLSGCQSEPTMREPKVLKVLGNSYGFTDNAAFFSVIRDDVELELLETWDVLKEPLKDLEQAWLAEMGDDMNAEPTKEQIDRFEAKLQEAFQDVLTGPDAPDVVMFDFGTFKKLAKAGLFLPLDTYIEKNKLDTSHFVQPILDALRLEDGSLYGLTPTFFSEAIIYDRQRFDELGLPYPNDDMTWDELIDLAHSLAGEKNGRPYYGLSFGTGHTSVDVIEMILHGNTEDISKSETLYSDARMKWWRTIQTLLQQNVLAPPLMDRRYGLAVENDGADDRSNGLNKQGVLIIGGDSEEFSFDPISDDPFLSGRSAMGIVRSTDIDWLMIMQNERREGQPELDWDFIALPAPEKGEKNAILNLGTVYAINANPTHPNVAWDFIDFVHGKRAARAKAAGEEQFRYDFLMYTDENRLPGFEDKNLAAFWPDHAAVFQHDLMENEAWAKLEQMKKAFVEMINSGQDPGEALQMLDERIKKQ